MKSSIAYITMAMFLGGCGLMEARYVDVSKEAGIREIVSSSRMTTVDMLLLGVDSYPSSKKIESYVLVKLPGFDGPEVLSRSLLPKGARLHFMGAQRCTNCYPQSVRFSVKVDGLAKEEPVYIDMSSMSLLE